MTNQVQERVKVHEKREERARASNGNGFSTVERREQYENVDERGAVREERLVKDSGAQRAGLAHKVGQFVWLIGGLLEAALGLRFLLKLMAANPNSPFAQFIYEFTDLFLWPFQALTTSPSTSQGMVLEIPTLFAMLVYGLATWLAVKLLFLVLIPSTTQQVTVYRREES